MSSCAIYARFEVGEALNEFIEGWDRTKDHGRHLGVVIGDGLAAECRGNQPQCARLGEIITSPIRCEEHALKADDRFK